MKKLFKILSISALCLILSACGGGGTGSSVSSNVNKILAIGDSIGAGFGGTNPWPRLVQEKSGVPVVNNSVPGRPAQGIESFIASEIATHKLIRGSGAAIAEVSGAFNGRGDLYLDDRFHPNNAGQDLIASIFVGIL